MEHNRRRVLAAAQALFAERGFREAKLDDIAELTRGAVYSHFPTKRALYFAVLAELAELEADNGERPKPEVGGPGAALREFARAWVERLPLAGDAEPPRLTMDLLTEVQADERIRRPYAQLMCLAALLLGLALEQVAAGGGGRPERGPGSWTARAEVTRREEERDWEDQEERPRLVRVAEAALTTLHGAAQLSAAAPGFVDEFGLPLAVERLAGLDGQGQADRWAPPHLEFAPLAVTEERTWDPPAAFDAVTAEPARLGGDGVVAVLGVRRLSVAEEAVRAVPPGETVSVIVVSEEPAELLPLARLVVAEVAGRVRRVFPLHAWPRVQVVFDETGALAAAAGVREPDDLTQIALRVAGGRVVASAEGYGACHAAGTWPSLD
ncbi:helix-turn-helix domain-containing protein [Nonomuraea sp. NPDC050310]|uniref:TetR/AcrR family transcriptional regulator n=1 Tax=Nonomuraea sp. NPDC050310 TaxID=3154935 RepID=UPI0033F22D61